MGDLHSGWADMKRIGRVVAAVVCGLVADAWAEDGPRIGGGPKLLSSKKFDVTRLYAPVVDGNPPPRVDDPKVKYDSFLPAKELMQRIDSCGGTALVAFKSEKLNRGWYLGTRFISDAEFEKARATVFSEIPHVYDVTAEYVPGGAIVGPDDKVRPQRIVRIKEVEAIEQLRKHVMVDYVALVPERFPAVLLRRLLRHRHPGAAPTPRRRSRR